MSESTEKEEKTWIGELAGKGFRMSREQMIERARERVMDRLSTHKTRTADFIAGLASLLHRSSEQMPDQKQLAALQDLAASRIDDLSQFLRKTDMTEIAERAERLARRQPALLFGAAFVVGFLFARYLTNSDRSRAGALSQTYASGR